MSNIKHLCLIEKSAIKLLLAIYMINYTTNKTFVNMQLAKFDDVIININYAKCQSYVRGTIKKEVPALREPRDIAACCGMVREVTLDLGKNGLKSRVSNSQSVVLTSIKQNINAKISRKTLS